MDKKKVVGFFAREHGLDGLKSLIKSDNYDLLCVFTHRKLPKSEDVARSERLDFNEYLAISEKNDIPLYSVDSKKEKNSIVEILEGESFDLMASISWRYLVPQEQLDLPKLACVNLHRGELPDYAGAEPVLRALKDKKNYVHITAHIMVEEIDAGPILDVYRHDVNYDSTKSLEANVDCLKKELTPHFGPLLIRGLDKVVAKYE